MGLHPLQPLVGLRGGDLGRSAARVLDLGCGALRGGVRYVKYLNANNYYGLDLNQHLLDAGYNKEIVPAHLETPERAPRRRRWVRGCRPFPGVKFDFVISVSVWIHLTIDSIKPGVDAALELLFDEAVGEIAAAKLREIEKEESLANLRELTDEERTDTLKKHHDRIEKAKIANRRGFGHRLIHLA